MIPENVLEAFGFKKCRAGETYLGHFSEDSSYNPYLDIYYNPKIHSDKQFALNVANGMAFRFQSSIAFPDNFAQRVVGEK